MSKTKQFSLYTFTRGKHIYTYTKDLKQALTNFNERWDLEGNGYDYPNMEYIFDPQMRVITSRDIPEFSEDEEQQIENEKWHNLNEKIIGFDRNKLNKLLL